MTDVVAPFLLNFSFIFFSSDHFQFVFLPFRVKFFSGQFLVLYVPLLSLALQVRHFVPSCWQRVDRIALQVVSQNFSNRDAAQNPAHRRIDDLLNQNKN